MIEFDFLVMGMRMTPETAPTPAIAQNLRAMEANFRQKLQGVVPAGEKLNVQLLWNRANNVEFNIFGDQAAVEAAQRRLSQS